MRCCNSRQYSELQLVGILEKSFKVGFSRCPLLCFVLAIDVFSIIINEGFVKPAFFYLTAGRFNVRPLFIAAVFNHFVHFFPRSMTTVSANRKSNTGTQKKLF